MSKRICVFGASITKGHSDDEKRGWTNRLDLELSKIKPREYSIYNLGISGNTTEDLLERFSNECIVRKPAIIIIAIGNNDASYRKSFGGSYVKLEKFKTNLEKLVKTGKKFTSEIIFIGLTRINEKMITPVFWDENIYYYEKEIKKYNQAIKTFSQKNNLSFIEMHDLLEAKDLADGVHPNAQGHEKMFNRIKDFLIKNKIIN